MKKKKIIKGVIIAICSLLIAVAIVLYAIFLAPTYSVKKPADSSTAEQPFIKGMSGISNFRIPSLVTLSDGTLIASCDARWNNYFDGGGLDTLASFSNDNGISWSCTFANYLGDNGNRYDARSSTFIDPAMIGTSDGTIYLATTFYPADVSLNSSPETPSGEKAFDENGRLLICKDNSNEFIYTLGDYNDDGLAPIIDKDGNALEKYLIDRYFNIYKDGKSRGNLFFKNSPFSVVPTTYIYLNISYDNGKTWDNPSLLNVKGDEEFFGIAPGRGLVLDDGTLIFSTYSLKCGDSSTQKSSFIYSTDNGISWQNAPELSYDGWSGESQLVRLDENTLRCFFRSNNQHISYSDISLDKMAWSEPVITDIENNSNCMISAINYSKEIDGKRAIALSCPTDIDKRENGKIFIFTLDDNNEMELYNTIDVKDGTFCYSCLTETTDGRLAILYEIENHQIVFENNININKLN